MKKYFFLSILFFTAVVASAQTQQRHKIAVFAPLYLDSAFNYSGNYVFNKTFPKFLSPGLEFYQGVLDAMDSLQRRNAPLDVYIYDSKSKFTPIAQQLKSPEMADVEMIIAQSTSAETRLLANAALSKKIPFISATLPNDAGVNNNPYFVVLNTTLQGHIEGIYKLLQRNYALDRIIVLRKSGAQEDAIKSNFNELSKTTASVPLNVKFVDVGADFTAQAIAAQLDSTKHNVMVAGSMDEAFGAKLASTLATLTKTYPTTLIGMPTWDNISLTKPEYKNLEIIYSTPFYYNRFTTLERDLAASFERNVASRPTDMYFRGYETAMRFALLLLDAEKDVASSLSRKGNFIFTKFDIQPVFKDKKAMTLDYFENKNLYFIRVTGGVKRVM